MRWYHQLRVLAVGCIVALETPANLALECVFISRSFTHSQVGALPGSQLLLITALGDGEHRQRAHSLFSWGQTTQSFTGWSMGSAMAKRAGFYVEVIAPDALPCQISLFRSRQEVRRDYHSGNPVTIDAREIDFRDRMPSFGT